MIWPVPAAFGLLALLTALSPNPPGRWFDGLLHLFGIGAVSARQAAISLWISAALASAAAAALLVEYSNLRAAWLYIDSAAVGLAVGVFLLWLASRRGSRGVGLGD